MALVHASELVVVGNFWVTKVEHTSDAQNIGRYSGELKFGAPVDFNVWDAISGAPRRREHYV